MLTTDKGNEFSKVDAVILPEGVHRLKEGINDIGVVDRAMQTLKKDISSIIARKGGRWDDVLQEAISAYNQRPHEAVYGPPEDVEEGGIQDFLALRRNARAFAHNQRLTQQRTKALESTGAFRAPVATGGRSFNPQYGGHWGTSRKENSSSSTRTGTERSSKRPNPFLLRPHRQGDDSRTQRWDKGSDFRSWRDNSQGAWGRPSCGSRTFPLRHGCRKRCGHDASPSSSSLACSRTSLSNERGTSEHLGRPRR